MTDAEIGQRANGRGPGGVTHGMTVRSPRRSHPSPDPLRRAMHGLGAIALPALLLALTTLLLVLAGCASDRGGRADTPMSTRSVDVGRMAGAMAMSGPASLESAQGTAAPDAPRGRMIRRNAALGLAVEDLPAAAERAEQIVDDAGGLLERSNARGEDESMHLGFRVPSTRLDETLDALAALGRTTRRSVSADDVTDQVVDLDARLRNLRALRDRLRGLLDRATKVGEVLEIERELTRVQSEIDSLDGRLERLEKDVALSVLSLDLEQEEPKRILGPLGYLGYGFKWFVEKLIVIRPGRP